jgi:hypothetical protein
LDPDLNDFLLRIKIEADAVCAMSRVEIPYGIIGSAALGRAEMGALVSLHGLLRKKSRKFFDGFIRSEGGFFTRS